MFAQKYSAQKDEMADTKTNRYRNILKEKQEQIEDKLEDTK